MKESSCEQLVELLPRNTTHFISPLLPCQVLTLLLGAIWVTLSCPVIIISSHSFTLSSVLVEVISHMVTLLTTSHMPPNLLPMVQTWFLLKWQLEIIIPNETTQGKEQKQLEATVPGQAKLPVLSRDRSSQLGTWRLSPNITSQSAALTQTGFVFLNETDRIVAFQLRKTDSIFFSLHLIFQNLKCLPDVPCLGVKLLYFHSVLNL